MHRFDNAHADRMKDHQPCELVAINQNDLVWMTFGKLFSGFRKIGGRDEDPLCCFVRAKTTAEIPDVGFANGVVRIIFLGLDTDAQRAAALLKDEQLRFLDAGELMLWSHAITRSDAWVLCGPDKASLRVGIRLGFRERLVSLERMLSDVGHRPKIELRQAHTQKWLEHTLTQLALLEKKGP
jgi:hypothetical protein